MPNNTLQVIDETSRLIIEGGPTLIIHSESLGILEIGSQGPRGVDGYQGVDGMQGPQGIQGIQGVPGLLQAVQDDPAPTLGGDLTLNGFDFIGAVDTTSFVLDGGLL